MNLPQQVFIAQGKAPSQVDRLIQVLHEANNEWVGLPELVDKVGAYAIHSRCADARKMGVNIINRVEFNPTTHRRNSFYKLLPPI